MSYTDINLGDLIREARERKGLARTKLAEFADISPNSMVKYEKAGEPDGKYPPLQKLAKICQILEIDPRHVFDSALYNGEPDLSANLERDEDGLLVDTTFSFVEHFSSDAELLNWKLSRKNIEDVNTSLDSISHLVTETYKLLKSEGKLPKQKRPEAE